MHSHRNNTKMNLWIRSGVNTACDSIESDSLMSCVRYLTKACANLDVPQGWKLLNSKSENILCYSPSVTSCIYINYQLDALIIIYS